MGGGGGEEQQSSGGPQHRSASPARPPTCGARSPHRPRAAPARPPPPPPLRRRRQLLLPRARARAGRPRAACLRGSPGGGQVRGSWEGRAGRRERGGVHGIPLSSPIRRAGGAWLTGCPRTRPRPRPPPTCPLHALKHDLQGQAQLREGAIQGNGLRRRSAGGDASSAGQGGSPTTPCPLGHTCHACPSYPPLTCRCMTRPVRSLVKVGRSSGAISAAPRRPCTSTPRSSCPSAGGF